jgi:hypothetical protein
MAAATSFPLQGARTTPGTGRAAKHAMRSLLGVVRVMRRSLVGCSPVLLSFFLMGPSCDPTALRGSGSGLRPYPVHGGGTHTPLGDLGGFFLHGSADCRVSEHHSTGPPLGI